eukprot:SAG31_NODE_4325_length_3355_cov_2.346130_2_plen_146_part_00
MEWQQQSIELKTTATSGLRQTAPRAAPRPSAPSTAAAAPVLGRPARGAGCAALAVQPQPQARGRLSPLRERPHILGDRAANMSAIHLSSLLNCRAAAPPPRGATSRRRSRRVGCTGEFHSAEARANGTGGAKRRRARQAGRGSQA